MTIDFTKEPTGPGQAPFRKDDIELRSWDDHGLALDQYFIDDINQAGYDVSARTDCIGPDSTSVVLLCLLNHAANFAAYDNEGNQIGDTQYFDLGDDKQLVTLDGGTSMIRRVRINVEDVERLGIYISTLDWTPSKVGPMPTRYK